jgi:DNA-binding HxlR family transcriptional regulator
MYSEHMAKRTYGQYCGLARAADVVGERWGLLIVRDLLVRDQRFGDLKRGLPKIPTNILTNRLKTLEEAGVVERKLLPTPRNTVVYSLTEYGRGLEDIVLALGRWGAKLLGEADPDEIVTPESLVMALRSTYRPESAGTDSASYELRVGDVVLHAVIDKGALTVEPGDYPAADLIISSGPAIRAVMAGEITPADAVSSGAVLLEGNTPLFEKFATYFHI